MNGKKVLQVCVVCGLSFRLRTYWVTEEVIRECSFGSEEVIRRDLLLRPTAKIEVENRLGWMRTCGHRP